ncbi:hypothetical protein BCV72DRAFT_85060 [Rhizopus microsporus var. microsporus]|uniref:Uncharacterized protein n=1 Tax=Rhizopus microsporus var. microsporus TaxID=86635 RepID=A0A1X0QMX7_RHIZD|nr:hypothetical protein BCV72DRAFT_85060 [Rhizopus microsporus var. microsporus]
MLCQEAAAITASINDDDANNDSNDNKGMTTSSSSSPAIQDNESILSSPIPTTSSTTAPLDTNATTTTTEAPPRFPWLTGDFDVVDAFYWYRCSVIQQAKDSLLQIEKSVHELLSLSHILLLAPISTVMPCCILSIKPNSTNYIIPSWQNHWMIASHGQMTFT